MHAWTTIWFPAAMLLALLSTGAIWKMVADVNTRLAEQERFSYLGWYWGKLDRLWAAHRRFYPHSPWRTCFLISFLAGVLCFGMAAHSLSVH
jgi:hypothetical protein